MKHKKSFYVFFLLSFFFALLLNANLVDSQTSFYGFMKSKVGVQYNWRLDLSVVNNNVMATMHWQAVGKYTPTWGSGKLMENACGSRRKKGEAIENFSVKTFMGHPAVMSFELNSISLDDPKGIIHPLDRLLFEWDGYGIRRRMMDGGRSCLTTGGETLEVTEITGSSFQEFKNSYRPSSIRRPIEADITTPVLVLGGLALLFKAGSEIFTELSNNSPGNSSLNNSHSTSNQTDENSEPCIIVGDWQSVGLNWVYNQVLDIKTKCGEKYKVYKKEEASQYPFTLKYNNEINSKDFDDLKAVLSFIAEHASEYNLCECGD